MDDQKLYQVWTNAPIKHKGENQKKQSDNGEWRQIKGSQLDV